MPKRDLAAEHAALLTERASLRALCQSELATMPANVARIRAVRLGTIEDRLRAIERTKQWKRSHAAPSAGLEQMDLEGTGDA
jgi:hypothetical protein